MDHVSRMMPGKDCILLCPCSLDLLSQRAYDEMVTAGRGKRALYEKVKNCCSFWDTKIGMDHFALPDDGLAIARHNGHLNRNFMGYTDLAKG